MTTFWVLVYIVVAWHHLGSDIEKRFEPRVQVMESEEICRLTAKELIRITPERILFGVLCQELTVPTK